MLEIPTTCWFDLKSFTVHFYNNNYYPTHALDTSPAHTCKEALLVASNSWLVTLHTRKQAIELCDELQSPICTFAISIATTSVTTSRAYYCAIIKWRLNIQLATGSWSSNRWFDIAVSLKTKWQNAHARKILRLFVGVSFLVLLA